MRNFEILVRLIIIAVCVYVAVTSAIDFHDTLREYGEMPPYPLTPQDPTAADFQRALWISFGTYMAAGAFAICASGEYALAMWLLVLLPFHALPILIVLFLSVSVVGILGMLVFVAANLAFSLTVLGALIGTAAAGFGLALLVEVDHDDRKTRRERARHDARWRRG